MFYIPYRSFFFSVNIIKFDRVLSFLPFSIHMHFNLYLLENYKMAHWKLTMRCQWSLAQQMAPANWTRMENSGWVVVIAFLGVCHRNITKGSSAALRKFEWMARSYTWLTTVINTVVLLLSAPRKSNIPFGGFCLRGWVCFVCFFVLFFFVGEGFFMCGNSFIISIF